MAADMTQGQEKSPSEALDRMERALARLEEAATSRDPATEELAALQTRHDELRRRVGTALGEVDALLGELVSTGANR